MHRWHAHAYRHIYLIFGYLLHNVNPEHHAPIGASSLLYRMAYLPMTKRLCRSLTSTWALANTRNKSGWLRCTAQGESTPQVCDLGHTWPWRKKSAAQTCGLNNLQSSKHEIKMSAIGWRYNGQASYWKSTLPETNIAPENGSLGY